jgi:uncharacterized protein YndB with AHSA1/START domain
VNERRAETEVVEHEVRIAAPPEVVFDYFTDPTKLVRWMGDRATLDPRPGGICRLQINGAEMSGRFVEVDFPHRIVFSWGWKEAFLQLPPEASEVEVAIAADGDGTLVRLSHRRIPPSGLAFHKAGWRHYLPRLSVAAAGGEPGDDAFANMAVLARAIAAES